MITLIANALEPLLPLRINEVQFVDPAFTLVGDNWSLNMLCPWRIRKAGALWSSCSEPDRADKVWDLVGHEILGVAGLPGAVDPVFELSGSLSLELFADTDTDPWALLLPGQTFVGSASVLEE